VQTTPLPAAPSDLDEFVRTLTAAFLDDPVMHWAFPDDAVRARRLPVMWRYVAGGIYLPRGACTTLPGHDAVAIWGPPGAATGDEFWEEHGARFAEDMEGDLERMNALGESMAEHHPHDHDHWYLLAIGTRPEAQGGGLGSVLLAHTLATADELRQPAYLEATSTRSRALYERFGFEAIAPFSPEGCPPLWGMWREPLS
jgi:GNAT superfamily N-acetyltransferase